jgi:hypothetical protein
LHLPLEDVLGEIGTRWQREVLAERGHDPGYLGWIEGCDTHRFISGRLDDGGVS